MTRDGARSTAKGMAERFGKTFVVWRMPKWPDGVYGVLPEERLLPPEAIIADRLEDVPRTSEAPGVQRSLF